ncbi:MAG: neocarzinostatin apoprotein domain-containing protein [Acidimicrobiales bacterium]
MKRQIGTVVSIAVLMLAGVLIPAATANASAKAPRLSVAPSTALRPGQIVVVKVSNVPLKRDVTIVECAHSTSPVNDCNGIESAFFITGKTGTFSVPLQVVRFPSGPKGADCATRFACEIAAITFERGRRELLAHANIQFSATAKAIVPRFTVSPAKDLTPNQFVTVKATGLAPDAGVRLSECAGLAKSDRFPFEHCNFYYYGLGGGGIGVDETNAEGTLSVRLRANSSVLLQFRRPLRPANCEVSPGCEFAISTFDPADPGFFARAPLTFNPAAKPITPVMTVSSSAALADGQMVTVTGGPFTPDAVVQVRECPTATSVWSSCLIRDDVEVSANDAGYIDVTFPVVEKSRSGKSEVDCTQEPCSISIIESGDIWYSAWTPISFDASLPAVRPAATVSPTTNLENGTLVTINGSKFAPGGSVDVEECVRHTSDCEGLEFGIPTDAAGAVEFGAEVVSAIAVFNRDGSGSTTVPCGKTGCVLGIANSSDPQQSVTVPISFAKS